MYYVKNNKWIIRLVKYSLFFLASTNSIANPCDKFVKYVDSYNLSINLNHYLPQGAIESIEKAYLIQKCIINNLPANDSLSDVVGFKAGLVGKASQEKFNAFEPVLGILQHHHINPPNKVKLNQNNTLLFEVELALKLKRNINNLDVIKLPIDSLIDAVAPAIEIADLGFSDLNILNAHDIVAANVGAKYVYLGELKNLKKVNIQDLTIKVESRQNKIENMYALPENYLNQIKWLLKKAYIEGYNLKKGMILLPGSIAKPETLKSGVYLVEFQGLGELSVSVQ